MANINFKREISATMDQAIERATKAFMALYLMLLSGMLGVFLSLDLLIFFVFFTGANTAQLILKEQEEGTLARVFTTPTPLPVILGGKFAAVFFTGLMVAAVYRLRVKRPDLPRPYRCWGYPFTPALYLAMCLAFLLAVICDDPLWSCIRL